MPNYKVVDSDKLNSDLTVVADAIRAKGGTSDALAFPAGMKTAIENIKGGGAELNIAYGDTAPEDTSKLWVKTSEPSGVVVSPNAELVESEEDGYEALNVVLPTTLMNHGCASVGSKIYTLGGMINGSSETTKAIHCFDTEAQSATTLPVELDTTLANMGCASVGSKIYLVGGWKIKSTSQCVATIRYFDTETQTLTTCTTALPRAMSALWCVAQDDKIYIFGGWAGASFFNKSIMCYDTTADTITTVATYDASLLNVPTVRWRNSFFSLGIDKNIFYFNSETLECGRIATIYEGAPNYTPSEAFPIAVVGDFLYQFNSNGTMWKMDLLTADKSWIGYSNKCGGVVLRSRTAVIGSDVYFIGGNTNDTTPFDTIGRYSQAKYAPVVSTDGLFLEVKDGKTVVPIINTEAAKIEVGIGGAYKGNANGIGEKVEAALYKDNTWTNI